MLIKQRFLTPGAADVITEPQPTFKVKCAVESGWKRNVFPLSVIAPRLGTSSAEDICVHAV